MPDGATLTLILSTAPDGATLILSTARRRRPGKAQPPSGIKGYNYQHIGDEKR
ncbi:hypothetical protein LTSEMIS_5330 [Salmonella enterica subsp. enterica serovar Mississippi str. A4-633]|nr:hypothetical protein LTSEMIS_5330 [Salmonella enterica subsp. enterica serovar Mississippi str. A4-633]